MASQGTSVGMPLCVHGDGRKGVKEVPEIGGWFCQTHYELHVKQQNAYNSENPIFTSNCEVSEEHWRKAVEDKWNEYAIQNAHILLTSGVHGQESGRIGPKEHDF